jgi:hypothetical protein
VLGALMPRVVAGNRDAVMTTPSIVVITYDDDPSRADLEAFASTYGASAAWAPQTAEYGVGALVAGTPRHLAGNAPATITDAQVLALLHANLGGAAPAWGAPDENTLYSFFFPDGTILDDGFGSLCCTDYDGYHYDEMIGGVDVAYAIQCTCPGFDGPGITDLQQLTVVASHETVEAVTDPRPGTDYAFAEADADHAVWTYVNGGETADMCLYTDTAYLLGPSNFGYAIQRAWSNAAAIAGHDPCVSEATTPYYQTIPDQPAPLTVSVFGERVASHGVQIAMGATAPITLHVLADAERAGPFTISLQDVNADYFGGSPTLTFAQPTGTYRPGDTLTVDATVVGVDRDLGGEAFAITTTPVGGGPATYFFGLIGQ